MPPTEKYDHLGQKALQYRKYFCVLKRNQHRKFFASAYNEYRMLCAYKEEWEETWLTA